MFWGLNLKANRKYTQTTSKSFHISQAALDSNSSQGGATQIFLTHEDQKFLICTLRKDSCEQATLDLNFVEGDEISFQSQGSGNVTLSGYLIENDPMSFMDDEDEEESEVEDVTEDLRAALNKKAKKKGKAEVVNNVDVNEDEDEDDSDLNDGEPVEGDDSDDVEGEGDDDDEDEEDEEEDEDDDESEEDEVQQPKAKQAKIDKPQKPVNGVPKETAEKKGKKEKKDKKEKKEVPQQKQQKAGGEKTLSGGIKIEDIRIGNGPEAKTGKRATVYYEGRLKSNNKVFDSLKQGSGFKFGLGRGEVIKGWDIGVAGMKVGGKRRITCPPHMAYGSRGSPPAIPPNSTLVFEVELKGVN